jgi:activator of HSP90 ATPase
MICSRESSSLLKLLKRCGLTNKSSIRTNPSERFASTQQESTSFPAVPGDESPFKATVGRLCFRGKATFRSEADEIYTRLVWHDLAKYNVTL